MKVSKKSIFIIISLSLIFLSPLKAKAQLVKLLPDCDVSIYHVQHDGEITDGVCADQKKYPGGCVMPGNYDPNKYGPVVQILTYNECGFEDFLQLFVNAFKFGLAVLGVVVLFFFIWGGFGFILAAGSQEKIQSAKNTLKGAFIGMLLVMTSWVFVNFYIYAFSADPKLNPSGRLFPLEDGGFLWWGKSCHELDTYQENCNKYNLHEGCGGNDENGLTSKYIKEVQAKLNEVKCCNVTVSGCFTPETKTCVQNFQIQNNLIIAGPYPEGEEPTELGVVDVNTWESIFSGLYTCNIQ